MARRRESKRLQVELIRFCKKQGWQPANGSLKVRDIEVSEPGFRLAKIEGIMIQVGAAAPSVRKRRPAKESKVEKVETRKA